MYVQVWRKSIRKIWQRNRLNLSESLMRKILERREARRMHFKAFESNILEQADTINDVKVWLKEAWGTSVFRFIRDQTSPNFLSFPGAVKERSGRNLPSSVSTNSANAICCAHRWSNCNYIQSRVQPLGKISESIFQQRHCKRCERSQVVRQPRSDSRMDERDCRWHRGLWNPMIQRLEAVERCGKDFSST